MPIGNYFLPEYTVANVNYPTPATSGGTFAVTSVNANVAYLDFSRTVSGGAEPHPLIHGWPLSHVFATKEMTYSYEIKLPVLLKANVTSGADAIRSEELIFWAAWVDYAASSVDKMTFAGGIHSVVVERASLDISVKGVTLGLSIRSNYDLGWAMGGSSNSLMSRQATSYDTFLKYQTRAGANVAGNLTPAIAWENTYGINGFSWNLKSQYETLCTTCYSGNSTVASGPHGLLAAHVADALNVNMVSLDGNLEVFGPIMKSFPVSLQETKLPTWGTRDDNVIASGMVGGGIQVWVGHSTPAGDVSGQVLAIVPDDLVVSEAKTSTSGQVVTETRTFQGVLSKMPRLPLDYGPYLA